MNEIKQSDIEKHRSKHGFGKGKIIILVILTGLLMGAAYFFFVSSKDNAQEYEPIFKEAKTLFDNGDYQQAQELLSSLESNPMAQEDYMYFVLSAQVTYLNDDKDTAKDYANKANDLMSKNNITDSNALDDLLSIVNDYYYHAPSVNTDNIEPVKQEQLKNPNFQG